MVIITAAKRRQARQSKPRRSRESKVFEIPVLKQAEEFTSSAACVMMALKYLNKRIKVNKDTEFQIWQEAVSGSVWHGSRYGVAYALAKRGAKAVITSNAKDEGYEKKLAVNEGVNLDTLSASFNEVRDKARSLRVKEQYGNTTVSTVKKTLNSGKIPIIVVNANALDPSRKPDPQWVVVKGYDRDSFYINDPYSDGTIAMEPQLFKGALGYDDECHMIAVSTR